MGERRFWVGARARPTTRKRAPFAARANTFAFSFVPFREGVAHRVQAPTSALFATLADGDGAFVPSSNS